MSVSKNRPLSVIPYYGGKAKMASFISERLDYTTSVFVTLFGGGCRELLNKPPHPVEFYNEYDSGLCALMDFLSNPTTAQKLIDKLYYDTKPTEEQFLAAKDLYWRCKEDVDQTYKNILKTFIQKYLQSIPIQEIDKLLEESYQHSSLQYHAMIESASEETKQKLQEHFRNWCLLRRQKEKDVLPRYRDFIAETISDSDPDSDLDLDLAVATYLVYTLSFSAIGTFYGAGKFKTEEAYKKHVLNLYSCADRLKDVRVLQLDAMSFFKQHLYENTGLEGNNILYDWLNNPDVMIFADPSYISPDAENQVLHYTNKSKNINIQIDLDQIDVEHGAWVSDAIEKAWAGQKMPKNLGSCYARSFGYREQEQFLKGIQNARCKMLVCNYDLQLYDRYLTPEKGWYKETYLTKTTVSNNSTKSKERLEVIWRNY